MAVQNELITALVEGIANLNTRLNDLASERRIPGPDGQKGRDGENGKDAPPVSDDEIKAQAVAWLEANITQPKDGQPGDAGADGKDGDAGRPPTSDEIRLAVDIWFEINAEDLRGPAGKDGIDGRDGSDGRDGRNGTDGDVGLVGPEGVGVALVEQRDEGAFWITLTDGREFEIELPKPKRRGGGVISSGVAAPVFLSAVDKQTQTAVANVATPMEFDTVVENYAVTIEDNVKITFGVSGLFNIQFSAQLHNTGTAEHDVSIWLARDGVAEPDSCTDITVPGKHGQIPGAVVPAWNFFYRAKAGEYCRILWSTPHADVFIAGIAARTNPVRPATPAIILTVNKVAP
jgi:hypothetical protein